MKRKVLKKSDHISRRLMRAAVGAANEALSHVFDPVLVSDTAQKQYETQRIVIDWFDNGDDESPVLDPTFTVREVSIVDGKDEYHRYMRVEFASYGSKRFGASLGTKNSGWSPEGVISMMFAAFDRSVHVEASTPILRRLASGIRSLFGAYEVRLGGIVSELKAADGGPGTLVQAWYGDMNKPIGDEDETCVLLPDAAYDKLFGRETQTAHLETPPRPVSIVMPEGAYAGTVQREAMVFSRPNAPSVGPWRREVLLARVTCDMGVPMAGSGEADYSCAGDYLYDLSLADHQLSDDQLAQKFADHVLATRFRRHDRTMYPAPEQRRKTA